MTAAAWVSIRIFCFVPLIYMPFFVAKALQYNLKSLMVMPLLLRIALALWGLLRFQLVLRLCVFFLAQRINKNLWKILFSPFYNTKILLDLWASFLFMYTSVHLCHVWVLPLEAREGIRCLGARITSNCEPLNVDAGNETHVLSKSRYNLRCSAISPALRFCNSNSSNTGAWVL